MNKLSAVLPTIGRIKYLDLSIKSILDQSTPFDEIIVFDNSIEQNIQKVSKFSNNNSIIFIRSKKRLAAIESWNKSVSLASSEYVTIIGDDDIVENNYCENAKKIIKYNEFGILKSYIINENGKGKKRLQYPEKKSVDINEFLSLRLNKEISLFVPGLVFNKKIFEKIGGFKNTYFDGYACSDELLVTEFLLESKKLALSDEYCWNYRVHSKQIGSVKNLGEFIGNLNEYLNFYESILKKNSIKFNLDTDYKEKYLKYGYKQYSKFASKRVKIHFFIKELYQNLKFFRKGLKFIKLKLICTCILIYIKNIFEMR